MAGHHTWRNFQCTNTIITHTHLPDLSEVKKNKKEIRIEPLYVVISTPKPNLYMSTMKNTWLPIVILMFLLSCSSDDGDSPLGDQEFSGTVIREVACQTKFNQLAYEIELDQAGSTEIILASNLPEAYKTPGKRIRFSRVHTPDDFLQCVMIYSPDMFFRLFDVDEYD